MRGYEDYKRILELWEQGHKKLHISKLTGIPRGTVRDCIDKYKSVAGLDQFTSEQSNDANYEEAREVLTLWEAGKSKIDIIAMTSIAKYWVNIYIDRYRSLAGVEEAQQNPQGAIINKSTRQRGYIPKERKNSDDELKEMVATSQSIRQVLQRLGLKPAGGNYKTIKQRIKELGLDTSHFKGHGWSKNQRNPYHTKRPLDEVLVKHSTYLTTSSLKKRLINEGIFEHVCVNCNLDTWLDQPIPLELDHINGDNRDNRLENLRLLCPNCHALTETYRGKNISIEDVSKN